MDAPNKPRLGTIAVAVTLSVLAVASGYFALGGLAASIFAVGYVGGLVLWLSVPGPVVYRRFRAPYWLTLAAFVLLHKPEERYAQFFDVLAQISGTAIPESTDPAVLLMLATGFLPWLLIPWLAGQGRDFGRYLAWTFFASMGLSELAHFVLPLFLAQPYGYFPGMLSVVILAPLAWWGLWRLAQAGATSGSAQSPVP